MLFETRLFVPRVSLLWLRLSLNHTHMTRLMLTVSVLDGLASTQFLSDIRYYPSRTAADARTGENQDRSHHYRECANEIAVWCRTSSCG